MKTVFIGKNDANQRLDRFLRKAFPNLPSSLIQKSIRKKQIKLNSRKATSDTRLIEGDVIEIFLSDNLLENSKPLLHSEHNRSSQDKMYFLEVKTPDLNIIYEDENLLLLDKSPGILCHSGRPNEHNTLINHVKAYLYCKGEYLPEDENSFSPALCNRIDRNTGGIVIAAKNADSLRTINRMIRLRRIERHYLCLVHGKPNPPSGILENYLSRDRDKRVVTAHDTPLPESKHAKTLYSTLKSNENFSLLECRLMTGRTHQIRVQMLSAGHPIVGDRKYGLPGKESRLYNYQALYSYRIKFDFKEDAENLNYLNQQSFEVESVPFADLI